MVRRLILLIVGIVSALWGAETSLAHDYVKILSQYQGSNTIVVNYNVDHFQEGVPVRFNFRLYQVIDGKPVEFDRVDVRFVEGNAVRKALTLPMSQDIDATYTHAFPTAGRYSLQVEYVRGPQRIATADFPLVVERVSQDNSSAFGLVQLALGFGLGAITLEVGRNVGLALLRSRGSGGVSVKGDGLESGLPRQSDVGLGER